MHDSRFVSAGWPRDSLETEGDDMDVLFRMLPGSRSWDVAQNELPRSDRSRIPVTPRTVEAREMVLSLLWSCNSSAPLIALMLSAGCTVLPGPVSEAGFVATTARERNGCPGST